MNNTHNKKKEKKRGGMRITAAERAKRIRQLRQQEQSFRVASEKRRRQQLQQHRIKTSNNVGVNLAGLQNMGNTCYLNSVLQCLHHSPPLVRYLLGQQFTKDKVCFVNRKPLERAMVVEFRSLMQQMYHQNRNAKDTSQRLALRPAELLKLLVLFNRTFAGGRQSDAQECLSTILQTLHVGLRLKVRITVDEGSGASTEYQQIRRGLKQYESHLLHDGYSAIDEIFKSQFESRLTCDRCGHIWASYDPYSLVPVEITARALTLYDCLDNFMTPEKLESVTCERCSEKQGKTNVTKQFSLWTLPQMLVVQLKRFDALSGGLRKINKFVQAPLKLNLTKYVSHPRVTSQAKDNPNALQIYDLKGIVCHSGQLHGGHYTAKCYRKDEGWYHFNDSHVQKITDPEKTLQSSTNYMFFYEMNQRTKAFWG